MRWALEASCMAGMRKLLGRGFADRTSEGHGLRLAALHINTESDLEKGIPWPTRGSAQPKRTKRSEAATRSAAAVGYKKSNNFGALLSGGEAAIRLHPVTRHNLIGISDEAVKRRPIPCQIGILHGTGIAVAWN